MHPARSTALRRWFFTSVLLALALILLIRFVVVPVGPGLSTWRQTLGSVLDNLTASAVTSLVLGLAYVLLFPAEEKEPIEVVQSSEIESTILRAAQEARQWAVRARTASYFTKATLPRLTEAALSSGTSITVRMQVLDPDNESLLAAYARFRSNHPGASVQWTKERVRREIYAAILEVALLRGRAPRVEVEVGLSPAFWVISLDLSDGLAMLTGQDRGDPALVFRRGNRFYEGWCQDFEASFTECRRVTPDLSPETAKQIKRDPRKNLETIREFFSGLGLTDCSDSSLTEVISQLKVNHHYA